MRDPTTTWRAMLAAVLDALLLGIPTALARRARRLSCAPTLVLVAKFPTAGKAKTRLAAAIGSARAAEAARAMLEDLLERFGACELPLRRVLLYAPPDEAHRERFEGLLAHVPHGDAWTVLEMRASQDVRSADLGGALAEALGRVRAELGADGPVAFIGADAPRLSEAALRAALDAAARGRAHLCPAADGGYSLLALPAHAPPAVFGGVAWSSACAAISQAGALAREGIRLDVGPTFRDVDELADWEAERAALSAPRAEHERAACARTWALMRGGFTAPADEAGGGGARAPARADDAPPPPLDADAVAAAARACHFECVRGEALGVGGLDEQLRTIARRVLATRSVDAAELARLGLRHTRGLLLHGPPGTGKTLAARALGRLLGVPERQVQLVGGPELLDQYVGRSEENVRRLFEPAVRAQRTAEALAAAEAHASAGATHPSSALHMLIFDEIDCLTARRAPGGADDGGGARLTQSRVLSQLLASLDGLTPLDSVFVVGTTNRRDSIDEALLRPGRLELQLEVGLPGAAARAQIVAIHTAQLARAGRLGVGGAELDALARRAVNYTGAELEAVVRAAVSRAIARAASAAADGGAGAARAWSVTAADLEGARAEVGAAYGDADGRARLEGALALAAGPGGAGCAEGAEAALGGFCDAVRAAAAGERGAGAFAFLVRGACARACTRAAASAALRCGAPMLRVLDEADWLGHAAAERVEALARTVRDAHQSPSACVVLHAVDGLVGACALGDAAVGGHRTGARVECEREALAALVAALRWAPAARRGAGGGGALSGGVSGEVVGMRDGSADASAAPAAPAAASPPQHACVLICTCANSAIADALLGACDGLFTAVLDVEAGRGG